MKKYLFLLLICGSANATTVSFNSSGNSNFTYSGVDFLNGTLQNASGGYGSVASATTTDYVAYNPNATSPSTFSWNNPGTFDLTSFVIAGAWGSQTLSISGYNGASLVGSSQFFVDTVATTFTANWSALTNFVIKTGNDFTLTPNLGGSGQHWALNDIIINENVSEVPLPAAAFMFAPALLGFMGLRRRAKNSVA